MEDFWNIVDNFKLLFPDNIQVKKAYLNFSDDDYMNMCKDYLHLRRK